MDDDDAATVEVTRLATAELTVTVDAPVAPVDASSTVDDDSAAAAAADNSLANADEALAADEDADADPDASGMVVRVVMVV